ncbi:hypothetical protein [Haloarchaeobius litoreus]|uniref:CcmD family protein n=1 Tax=Haloarchaeobius litoreus TaxID=755306 RepID=A0ABD6DIN6_9EURY|nr:hypothetical protein [Haloarchaeobius litoreus]
MNEVALVYYGGGTLLFFFWVYGIVSFVRDLRRTYVPALRKLLTARRAKKQQRAEAEQREERERQLY